ncbi:hypothetical protein AU195_09240 [Mycobacterium sp. IS-1496]|nr:hypothetical protein [Mycobacterium sp. IS-1496]KUI34694.1 hypothetical protein AU195_09240 [Mycobacterium sp. IS-1496]
MRQIGTRYLFQDDRIGIADLRRAGLSMCAIADSSGARLLAVDNELNPHPRMVLQTVGSTDLFANLLASGSPSAWRR